MIDPYIYRFLIFILIDILAIANAFILISSLKKINYILKLLLPLSLFAIGVAIILVV